MSPEGKNVINKLFRKPLSMLSYPIMQGGKQTEGFNLLEKDNLGYESIEGG